MKKIQLLVLATLLLVASFSCACNNESDVSNNNTNPGTDSTNSVNTKQKDSISTAKVCDNTVGNFLKWYKTNYEKVSSMQDAVVGLEGDSATPQYRVNFDNAEKYLGKLRSSGLFSEKFLQDKLQYFKDADKNLVKIKQNDGPPERFEFDLLLYTQEPEAVLENGSSLKTEVIEPNRVKLISLSNGLTFTIEQQQGSCVIDSISFAVK